MKTKLRPRVVTRSLKGWRGLFKSSKVVNPRLMYPDEYFKQVFLTKRMYQGIEFIARVNRISKKQAVNDLIELGMQTLYARKMNQEIVDRLAAEEAGKQYYADRFILQFRKWAREKGMDIHKII
jgi:hypothetical protein